MAKQKSSLKKFLGVFKDSQGNVVVTQKPNLPIFVWALATIIGLTTDAGGLGRAVDIIAVTSLVYWALLEVFNGVNLFRRVLGMVVLVFLFLKNI